MTALNMESMPWFVQELLFDDYLRLQILFENQTYFEYKCNPILYIVYTKFYKKFACRTLIHNLTPLTLGRKSFLTD